MLFYIALPLLLFCHTSLANNYTSVNTPAPSMTKSEAKKFYGYHQNDIYYGDIQKAKVIVTAYTAFSCHHCSHFMSDILPKLKREYIDKKGSQTAFIFREFAMSISDVRAQQMLECKNNMPNQKKLDMLDMLYRTANNWAYSNEHNKKLAEMGRIFGISDSEIFTCLDSKNKEMKIIQDRVNVAQKTGLKGTPWIVVNGNPVEGYSYQNIASAIEKELK